MCSEGERVAFRALEQIGLRDTLRLHHSEGGLFSWWDYRMLAFQKNRGLRIDAILASESLAERCTAAGIDREMRKGNDPSDHAPAGPEFFWDHWQIGFFDRDFAFSDPVSASRKQSAIAT